jgi:predicted PurR-regulated permease PerM
MTELNIPPSPLVPARGFDRQRLFVIFFFAVYAFLLYQLFRMLSPFLAPLLSAVMLALVVFPLREYLERRFKSPNLVALALTLLVVVTVVVPVSLLIWMVVTEATQAVPALSAWIGAHQNVLDGGVPQRFQKAWDGLDGFFRTFQLDVKAMALDAVRDLGNKATALGAGIVAGFFGVMFQLLILILALFFFLRDGPVMIGQLIGLVPMEEGNKTLVLQGLDRTLVAMVRGSVITAAAQGGLTGVGLALFGVPFPVLLGFVAVFLSVVPVVGAALIWVPGVVYLLLTDHVWAGVGLTLWGLFGVGLIDNLLRPFVIGSHAQLPETLLFLGVLGGIQVYGLVGGLISPLLIAGVIAFARIYRESYLNAPRSGGS